MIHRKTRSDPYSPIVFVDDVDVEDFEPDEIAVTN
jgi:hypothetical protein